MRNKLLIGAAAAALVIPVAAHAQETTSLIRGSVMNNGAPVAGATVTATHVPSGTTSTTVTGADGTFSLAGLRVGGPYTVEVTSDQGTKQVTDIYTVVQQAYNLPVELAETGSNDIVVTARSIVGAGVKSDGPQTILTQKDISKVASVNRDVRDVERRDPFASLDLSNGGANGGAISFAGVNPRYNRFTINGVTVGDTFGLNQDASPNVRGPVPLDALAQVSVSVAPYDFRQTGFQGGAIDTVLLSGTNQFHVTGFYSQNTDGLSGNQIRNKTFTVPSYKSETYGATISGPILKDKLFFMVSAERNTDPRPYGTQLSSTNVTQAQIDSIVGTAKNTYGLDAGGVLTINDRKDEKIVGRVDWNITDGQRLSLSYINAYDASGSQNNTSATSYGLSTNAYQTTELLKAGIAQLNSDWTSNFSTEARLIYKATTRGQEPLTRDYGQIGICLDPTGVGTTTSCTTGIGRVFFGPDISRQTNSLFFDTWAGSFLSRLRVGNHELKVLAEFEENRTTNNFVQYSLGDWYFDSLADYQNRRANTLTYNAVIDGTPLGAAANFKYDKWGFGVQDDWQVNDTLQVTYGFRWDLYGMRDKPVLNPYFVQRYGYSNQTTYKGLDLFEPRVSFNWKPIQHLTIRGGGGIFGGGTPDIYLSNSFSNTVLTNRVTFTRSAAGADTCLNGVPDTVCQAALNNVSGNVPTVVSDYVRNAAAGSTTLPRTNTGALDPNFKLPSSWKATLSADYKFGGWTFGADYYFSKVRNGILFTDARSIAVGTLPDGRTRYNGYYGFSDTNYDIILGNSHQGRSHIGVVRFQKEFDWGLSFGGSYTLQDVRDVSSATSSTINSNYRYQVFADPNSPTLGTSNDQIKWSWKYNLGFDHAFFGDYRTVFQLFGETRAGRPYSYTFQSTTSNRSDVFGTVLTGGATSTNLLYIPTGVNDPLVQYDTGPTGATATSLNTLIESTSLKKYRGQIVPKNTGRLRAFTRLDLHLEQQIPTFVGGSRVTLFADINNLPNLLNKDWGGVDSLGFPPSATVVTVNCVTATGTVVASGTAIGSAGNPAAGCVKYQYSSFRSPNADTTTNSAVSTYSIRLGVRFTF